MGKSFRIILDNLYLNETEFKIELIFYIIYHLFIHSKINLCPTSSSPPTARLLCLNNINACNLQLLRLESIKRWKLFNPRWNPTRLRRPNTNFNLKLDTSWGTSRRFAIQIGLFVHRCIWTRPRGPISVQIGSNHCNLSSDDRLPHSTPPPYHRHTAT